MAELTKRELEAAEERAGNLSLADDDVALQTSSTLPEGLGVKPSELGTAGADQHGPVYSLTRRQVQDALAGWGTRGKAKASNGRRGRRGGRVSQAAREQVRSPGAQTTPVPAPDDTGQAATGITINSSSGSGIQRSTEGR